MILYPTDAIGLGLHCEVSMSHALQVHAFLFAILPLTTRGFGVAPEPWPPLNSGNFSGSDQPYSPDPLVRFQFNAGTNDTILQIFSVAAVAAGPMAGTPLESFLNTSSAIGSTSCSIIVQGNGTLLIDFGVELPAWLEFDSTDLQPGDLNSIQLGISEYTVIDYVGLFKNGPAVQYCDPTQPSALPRLCTYRLETNSELYEGVRYGFITVDPAPTTSFIISGLRAVSQVWIGLAAFSAAELSGCAIRCCLTAKVDNIPCVLPLFSTQTSETRFCLVFCLQAKAVNYSGSFATPGDPVTERVWYTAAYTVRGVCVSVCVCMCVCLCVCGVCVVCV
jgi:hypothetical protein